MLRASWVMISWGVIVGKGWVRDLSGGHSFLYSFTLNRATADDAAEEEEEEDKEDELISVEESEEPFT